MNTIECPLVIKLSQNSELLSAHDIETSLNSIIYDLKPEVYQVEVKQSSQLKECRGLQSKEFEFNGRDKEVCKKKYMQIFGELIFYLCK